MCALVKGNLPKSVIFNEGILQPYAQVSNLDDNSVLIT